jgi:uncharacterized protein (DUF885 family)
VGRRRGVPAFVALLRFDGAPARAQTWPVDDVDGAGAAAAPILGAEIANEADGKFRTAAQGAVDALLISRPEWATSLGDHRYDDQLDDLTEAGLVERARLLRRHRGALAGIARAELGLQERVDLAMLLGELDKETFVLEDLARWRWDPLAYNVGEGLYPLLSRDVVPVPDRLRAIASRLHQVPERLAAASRQLVCPPKVHVETALHQHQGSVAMVRDEVRRLLSLDPGLTPLVEQAQDDALRAMHDFEGTLHRLLEGPHRSARTGPELFARCLSLELAADMRADEVFQRAQDWADEVQQNLDDAAARYLGSHGGSAAPESRAGTVRAALDRVAEDRPDSTSTFLGAIEAAVERCTAAVRELGIVSLPSQPMRIELMPTFRRGVGGAYCDPAGPLDSAGETSFAVEPPAPDWTADQTLSFYREYNNAMLVNLTVHEAMPGHMVQLAHARRYEGSTIVRKILESGTFVEGWAVHAERIMAEQGNGGPPVRLQQLKMQLRVAINALLDISFHAGDMGEAEAMDLMARRGYQEEREAHGKWRRVQLTSGQLSTYFVGYAELSDVIARWLAKAGGAASYDGLLAHGSPPPKLLGQLLGVG